MNDQPNWLSPSRSLAELLKRAPEKALNTFLSDLPLSLRTLNALRNAGARRLADVAILNDSELMKIRGLGRKSYNELLAIAAGIEPSIEAQGHELSSRSLGIPPATHGLPSLLTHADKPHLQVGSLRKLLNAVPRSVLDTSLSKLSLSRRAYNALASAKLMTLADVAALLEHDLLNIRGLGRKSCIELLTVAAWAAEQGGIEASEPAIETDRRQTGSEQADIILISGNTPTLRSQIESALEKIDSRDAHIVRSRLASRGTIETLDDIGHELGVTRERARQLETRGLRQLLESAPLLQTLNERLEGLFLGRTEPLYLDLLSVEDAAFAGFDDDLAFLAQVIARFCEPRFNVWPHEERYVVARVTKPALIHLRKKIIATLQHHLVGRISLTDTRLLIEAIASSANAGEFAGELEDSIKDHLHFARNSKDEHLVRIGSGVKAAILTVLTESEHPLSFDEIVMRCNDRMARPKNHARYRQAFRELGVHVFARRRYGLAKHTGVSDEWLDRIGELGERVILSGKPSHQWHSAEVLRQIEQEVTELPSGVDAYVVNITLARRKGIEYLRRMMWRRRSGEGANASSRREIGDLCEAALIEAGHPLTTLALKKRIAKVRGLNELFMPQANGVMARLDRGVWGLVARDFGGNRVEHTRLLSTLESILKRHRRSLTVDQVKAALLDLEIDLPKNLSIPALLGLAQVDPRFRVISGKSVGLRNRER